MAIEPDEDGTPRHVDDLGFFKALVWVLPISLILWVLIIWGISYAFF